MKNKNFEVYFDCGTSKIRAGVFNKERNNNFFFESNFFFDYLNIEFELKNIVSSIEGKTKEYLDFILNRLTFFGSIYLVVICVTPTIITGSQTRFGGTSMLILVSVAVRVLINIQSFLYSDLYEQSYKSKGKFKGSRKRF